MISGIADSKFMASGGNPASPISEEGVSQTPYRLHLLWYHAEE